MLPESFCCAERMQGIELECTGGNTGRNDSLLTFSGISVMDDANGA